MSFRFGNRSARLLEQLDERLVKVLYETIAFSYIDFTVISTKRTILEQERLLREGNTRTLNSLHLNEPKSHAVDIAPIKFNSSGRSFIPWDDLHYFYFLAGSILHSAQRIIHRENADWSVRWGGDWNMNRSFVVDDPKESLNDLVHFELCFPKDKK